MSLKECWLAHVARLAPTPPSIFLQEYNYHLGAVNTVTFIDDARRFVSSSDDKSLRVWEFGIPVQIKCVLLRAAHAPTLLSASRRRQACSHSEPEQGRTQGVSAAAGTCFLLAVWAAQACCVICRVGVLACFLDLRSVFFLCVCVCVSPAAGMWQTPRCTRCQPSHPTQLAQPSSASHWTTRWGGGNLSQAVHPPAVLALQAACCTQAQSSRAGWVHAGISGGRRGRRHVRLCLADARGQHIQTLAAVRQHQHVAAFSHRHLPWPLPAWWPLFPVRAVVDRLYILVRAGCFGCVATDCDVLDEGPLQAEPQEDLQGAQHSGLCLPGELQPRCQVCPVR